MTQPSRTLWYFIGVGIALVLIAKAFTLYTDYLWFVSLGQSAVFLTILKARVLLVLVFGVPFFLWLHLNIRYARRPLPDDVTLIGKRLLPAEERAQIEEYADKALLLFALIGAFMVAAVASGHWREWLQFVNAVPFSATGEHNDAIFGRDAGFYVFKLGFIQYAWRSVFYGIVITLVTCVLVHLYQEAIRVVGNVVHAIPRARAHVLVLLAVALFARIYTYRIAQYNLLFSTHGKDFFGASYADVAARLPVLYVLMVVCALAGIACLLSVRSRSLTVPGGALAAVLLVSILGGWLYPMAVQRLVVGPNELVRETPYIENNIKATNLAYGTNAIADAMHHVDSELTWDDVDGNVPTIYNIRLWDHRPLQTSYQQLQSLRKYYDFPDVDNDRYTVGGEMRQVMLAPRQLNYDRIADSWVNRHLLYTHGYGIVMSPVTEIRGNGQPVFWVKDLPPKSDVGIEVSRPGIYYGTSRRPRLIERISPPEFPGEEARRRAQAEPAQDPAAGGPQPGPAPAAAAQQRPPTTPQFLLANTAAEELDYPRVSEGGGGDENVMTKYSGLGGIPIGSFWRKLAFAIRFQDYQILLTEYITTETKLLMNRELPERLQVLAPFLLYEPDPYITVTDDGLLKWICDAYTISNTYPYSVRTPWFGNYLRNSVKVVMDAYDGIPEFYVVDDSDPMIQCYQKIFPTLFRDAEQMDTSVKRHLRYPQMLLRIQAGIYAKYHQKNPQTFYQGEDEWAIPPEKYASGNREVEAYYQVMELPGEQKEEFLLMLPFVLAKFEEKNMVAWMAARCDPERYGELIVYRFPKDRLVYGPYQFESRVDNDPGLSEQFTLWSQEGSRVIRGNTLAIPVAGTLLYASPIYLQSADGPMPELRLVILMHGDTLVHAPTLDEALVKLLGPDGGGRKKPAVTDPEADQPAQPAQPTSTVQVSGDAMARIRQILGQAIELDKQAEAHLREGDLGKYRDVQRKQAELLDRAWKEIEQ